MGVAYHECILYSFEKIHNLSQKIKRKKKMSECTIKTTILDKIKKREKRVLRVRVTIH